MADSQPPPKTNSSPRTFEIRANPGEMIKPAELIDITGTHDLTYTARQMFNRLIAHAHGPDMAKTGYRWTIPLSELRGNHKGNERIQEALLALMRVVVTSHHPDGRTTTNVRLLGDNTVDWEKGTLTFELSGKLVELMRDSTIFGKLELRTMTAFTSKYALALYEMVARRARLNFVFSEEFELEKFRELLGVPRGLCRPGDGRAPDDQVPIPLALEDFTRGLALEDFLYPDPLRLTHTSARFVELQHRIGRWSAVRLAKLHLPLLTILAEQDAISNNVKTRALVSRSSASPKMLIQVPGRHGILFDAPLQTAAVCRRWLDRLAARSPTIAAASAT